MKSIHALLAMTSLSLLGCAEPESDETPLPAPMVSADRDGAHLDIYELSPTNLAVVATGELPEGIEGKTPVEIYELISGAQAPTMLVERQAAIAALQARNPTDHVGEVVEAAPPARSTIASLSGPSFQASECNPGVPVDFDLCFTNRTNDYIRRFTNIEWIHAHAHAYSGSIVHSMWHRSGLLGNFQLINTEPVSGSSFVSLFSEGADGDYEVWITSASGDGYHLSMHGDF